MVALGAFLQRERRFAPLRLELESVQTMADVHGHLLHEVDDLLGDRLLFRVVERQKRIDMPAQEYRKGRAGCPSVEPGAFEIMDGAGVRSKIADNDGACLAIADRGGTVAFGQIEAACVVV